MTPTAEYVGRYRWFEDPDAIDWLNGLLANAGDEWDRDESMWNIALEYVRHLEALAYNGRSEP